MSRGQSPQFLLLKLCIRGKGENQSQACDLSDQSVLAKLGICDSPGSNEMSVNSLTAMSSLRASISALYRKLWVEIEISLN